MKRLLQALAITASAGGLLGAGRAAAQVLPPAPNAPRVEITRGPALESATDRLAIITWTTNNPGGPDVQFGIVHYGTGPGSLGQAAKSPIRLNRDHAFTTFRVRVDGLEPRTTYYYTVASERSNGDSSGLKSPVRKFTTPGPGERMVGRP